ncbi:MAG TPA: DUF4258 domain-containing protein [Nanoarchaeota archaeon]|nr:DUF4258 domain-containing protein [Nanoarchaeota archaeon]
MRITFSDHAIKRLYDRDINEETVKFVIENADTIKESFDNRKVASKKMNGKTFTVVYVEKEKYIKIITLY